MGINSNNIRVVIHIGAPISMCMYTFLIDFIFLLYSKTFMLFITNLIQKAGRAGRDGNLATHYIFFSKKDIRINYSIVAEYRKMLVILYFINTCIIYY